MARARHSTTTGRFVKAIGSRQLAQPAVRHRARATPAPAAGRLRSSSRGTQARTTTRSTARRGTTHRTHR